MVIDLGYQPAQLALHLTTGSDWNPSLERPDGADWPDGTAVSLQVGNQTWPATVTGPTISWDVDHTLVDALGGPGTRVRARMLYSDGATAELVWMIGQVVWHG